jgi:hypothetical protein
MSAPPLFVTSALRAKRNELLRRSSFFLALRLHHQVRVDTSYLKGSTALQTSPGLPIRIWRVLTGRRQQRFSADIDDYSQVCIWVHDVKYRDVNSAHERRCDGYSVWGPSSC